MKKLIIIFFSLALSLGVWAQGQGVQIAPKGGVSRWSGQDVQTKWAPMGGLDLGYIIRWRLGEYSQMGLRTGAGLSYTTSQLSTTITDQYTRLDYYDKPHTLEYTCFARTQEQHKQLQVDIPLLMAFQTHGFTLNIGPRLIWMAYDKFTQNVDSAYISAYFPKYGVTSYNEPETGRLDVPYTNTRKNGLPTLSLALSAELGYEFCLTGRYTKKNEQYIGFQLFADYGVFNIVTPKQEAYLAVDPITGPNQKPAVTVGAIAPAKALRNINLGLRIYYTIHSVDYSEYNWHRTRRR